MENYKIGKEIRKISNLIHRNLSHSKHREILEATTCQNMWIIEYLLRNSDRDIFQKDIEDEFSIRRSTVSKMLTLMEKKGFIQRESVPCDARLKKLVVTDKGISVNNCIKQDFAALENKIKKDITNEELEVFKNIMKKIAQNLEETE